MIQNTKSLTPGQEVAITTAAERLINGGSEIFNLALALDQHDHRAALAAEGAWIRKQACHACKSSKIVGMFDEGVLYTFEDGSRLLMVGDVATCNANDIEAAVEAI